MAILNRVLHSRYWGYLLAVLGVALATGITLLIAQFTRPGSQVGFLFLIAILAAAWTGYGPGVFACILTFAVLPYFFFRGFSLSHIDAGRFGLTLLTALLMSAVAAGRRRFERRLQEANRKLEAGIQEQTTELALMGDIIRSSDDAIISKTLDGVIRTWNPAAERIYGYTAAEAVGKSMTMLLPPDRPNEESDILKRIGRGERVEHFETVRVRKDGRRIHVSLTISPVHDATGAVVGASHIARDTTERTQFEQQLRQTAKLESLGVLAGGVAHDFNNLLTGIMGNASLVFETMSAHNPNRALLKEVLTASESAANLTRQLLAYAGKGRFVVQLIDMSAMIAEISNLIRTSIPKSVQLNLQLAQDLPPIEGDIAQMQQIVMNLVINAAEAIGANPGTILIQTGVQLVDEQYLATLADPSLLLPSGEYVMMEVHDNGCGMSEETRAKIFDPFFTTKFTGRGLGLSAVQGIVHGHRGALKVYSKPGEGSTFKLLLPAAKRADKDSGKPQAAEDLHGSGLVLVVDDEPMVRNIAKATLERHGYTVMLAEHGQEAVDIFRKIGTDVQLVLVDLTMPVMGGEETVRRLKAMNGSVRILLSSGFNEVEAVQRFTGKGLAGFIQKPYTAAALAKKVKMALAGAAPVEGKPSERASGQSQEFRA
jgi:PAS domain S-box-containing protein